MGGRYRGEGRERGAVGKSRDASGSSVGEGHRQPRRDAGLLDEVGEDPDLGQVRLGLERDDVGARLGEGFDAGTVEGGELGIGERIVAGVLGPVAEDGPERAYRPGDEDGSGGAA